MKIYSYVVHHDYGLAPNPFGKYCTLSVCKTKIRRSKNLQIGDWIIGTGSKHIEETTRNPCVDHLIYAMKVSEKILMEDYWNDDRFQYKKPILNGSLTTMYGDNIYYKKEDQTWGQLDSAHSKHDGDVNEDHLNKDTDGKYAIISEEFYYFGDNCPELPDNLKSICRNGRGEKTIIKEETIDQFISWLKNEFSTGIHGDPLNWRDHDQQSLF